MGARVLLARMLLLLTFVGKADAGKLCLGGVERGKQASCAWDGLKGKMLATVPGAVNKQAVPGSG